MLIFVIVLHVPAREGFRGLVVVFDVIGAETLAGVADVHVVVGDEQITLAALRALCRKLGYAALRHWRADLLRRGGWHAEENQGER
jgi:hypothetical protein